MSFIVSYSYQQDIGSIAEAEGIKRNHAYVTIGPPPMLLKYSPNYALTTTEIDSMFIRVAMISLMLYEPLVDIPVP